MVICSRVPPRASNPGRGRISNLVRERLSSRRALAMIGLFTLACGLIPPTPCRSQSSTAREQTALQAATPGAEPNYDFVNPFELNSRPLLKQSLFGFAGRTNSGNLGDTFAFGIGAPRTIFYDNYIVGGAYQRDFFQFNSGILIGAEIGLADRFGHYAICCDTIAYSNSMTHSAELWGGVSFRHQGVALFDTVRISPGFVFGLSAVSSPIGQEALHQFDHQGSAKVLFYLGFDLAFALTGSPNTELVFRIQHRSGGYGTLGGIKEGNNANVIGIRQRF
jgi:hypothetical protein